MASSILNAQDICCFFSVFTKTRLFSFAKRFRISMILSEFSTPICPRMPLSSLVKLELFIVRSDRVCCAHGRETERFNFFVASKKFEVLLMQVPM